METPAIGSSAGTAQPARSHPVWWFAFKPRWLLWHLTVVCAFWGMLWLGDWQYHRALGGNGLSWAYTFEWPMFACFAVVFWGKTMRDEYRIRAGTIPDPRLAEDLAIAAAKARALAMIDPNRPRALTAGAEPEADPLLPRIGIDQADWTLAADEPDEDLDKYNAYLARLSFGGKGRRRR
jgi:hypothetical protein